MSQSKLEPRFQRPIRQAYVCPRLEREGRWTFITGIIQSLPGGNNILDPRLRNSLGDR